MNESETRAEHIDPQLTAAGWGVIEGSRVLRELHVTPGRIEGPGRRSRPLIADYVLVYRNTKLAVIEAKAWDVPVAEGVAQAKNYADKLKVRFAYAANGRAIYGVDFATGAEGDLDSFPTPDELWTRTFARQDRWRDRFAAVPFEDKGGSHPPRYYQDIAVARVMEAIAAGQDRILLTLATGTGKTFIAFQIAWKLFHSRWNLVDRDRDGAPQRRPRVLFLADRNILANQAFNAFSAFPEDALVRIAPDEIRKKGKVPKNGSLFFTIFQTFLSGPAADSGTDKDGAVPEGPATPAGPAASSGPAAPAPGAYFGEYPPDFFDFIVIDECHRGGANDESTWRGILEYFAPAVQLGLTATPKRQDNVDTYAYFGEPVYIYSLKEGINDGFLTPFKVRQISTTLDEYVYTPDDTLVEGEIETGQRFVEGDFNRIIEIREREALRVKLFMDLIDPREKTLVFCATQAHAAAVRDLVNQMKTCADPGYCQRVTANDGALGDQHLRDFQDNEKTIPTILTTSQKLSTGVDARNIRNIVLMRPVNSMIEFKQIIGRGTRLYDGKHYFTIYDFVKAHHHFSDPEWDGEPLAPEPKTGPKPKESPDVIDTKDPPTEYKPRQKARVKLADGKERTIQHMMCTSFWHPDGTPMTSQQFMEMLFGRLPEFFASEEQLRTLWSAPDTRRKLLDGLAEKGFGRDQLAEMQRIIDAQNSDVFDVLAHVAYALAPLTRAQRADSARVYVHGHFEEKQRAFLNFVLQHYVQVGVEELDQEKLKPLLLLQYHDSLQDALAELGRPEEVGRIFAGFQKYLYQTAVA